PSSVDQTSGRMFLCSKDGVAMWKDIPADREKLKPLGDFSQVVGLTPKKGSPASKVDGALVAMNLRTNKIAWKKSWPNDMCYSGVMSTAGGLVFGGRNHGYLQAYDWETGTLLGPAPEPS